MLKISTIFVLTLATLVLSALCRRDLRTYRNSKVLITDRKLFELILTYQFILIYILFSISRWR